MSGHKYVGKVGGLVTTVSASVTRPSDTTQYAVGDIICNSTTASSVTAMTFSNVARLSGESVMIRTAKLTKSDDDVTSALFRLHLFDEDPTATDPTNGDNGAIQLTGVKDGWIGSIDFDLSTPDIHTDGNAAIGVPLNGSEVTWRLGSGTTLYGLLEARATYTPASAEVFTAYLNVVQD